MRRLNRISAGFIGLALVAGLAACSGGGTPKDPAVTPTPVLTDTLTPAPVGAAYVTTGRGPNPPDKGAWLGAYADPYNQSSVEKQKAIDDFETLIGRKLAIVHSFHPWTDDVPSAYDLQIVQNGQLDLLSWAGTDTVSMADGTYDATIIRTADSLRDMHVPILLRFRWEMDRPNLQTVVHSPEAYIAAWKHVRSIFTTAGAKNVGFVWCPLATGFATGNAQQYYPGDDQVDWLCTDVYPTDQMTTFSAMMAPVMQFASQHPRPMIIGEFGVEAQPQDTRAAWFTAMASDIKQQPQIKAVVYFNSNHRSKPIHNYTMKDTPADLSAFKAFANDPYFSAMAN
jgi:hypothetical protein